MTTTITKLLIANRGEIARRIIRTARKLSIPTVAIYSDPDANAPFVGEADEAIHLVGAAPSETYLNIELIVSAALRSGANAIHPGYGFLSESAPFAMACQDAGILFVGPPPAVIEQMGSKVAAKALMAKAGVPILEGAVVTDTAGVMKVVDDVGWPLLIKAAFGGGGRGMRVVRSEAEATEALASATREAQAAFGNPTIFVERFVEDPRHVEVQIFADALGTTVHLFERECSIQRRYQKIIEEAPSPAVDAALREELGSAAVAAAKAIGYVGAGTVEFILDRDGRFFFLEVNTRLQVEHAVTEAITGLDLVALQLSVAAGDPLPASVLDAEINGHAIEARLYAEDVVHDFLPVSGRFERVRIPPLEGIRVDSAVEDGSEVSTHYDAMIAKVIAWAPNRELAARRLAASLREAKLHGPKTNRALLTRILGEAEFLAGTIDTGYLQRHDPAELGRPLLNEQGRRTHAIAALLAGQMHRRTAAAVQRAIPPSWRNVGSGHQHDSIVDDAGTLQLSYRLARQGWQFCFEGEEPLEVGVCSATSTCVDLEFEGIRRSFEVAHHGATMWVDSSLGTSSLHLENRFPVPDDHAAAGSLMAPMPGSVVRVHAEVGATVEAGQVLIVLEAMKMEHAVRCPHDGLVAEVLVTEGQQVVSDQVLVIVEDGTANGE